MLAVFHRTSRAAAEQILRSGFRNTTARYLTDRNWSGVWVADRPLDNSEGASGEVLLEVEIAEEILTSYEWIGKDKPYHERPSEIVRLSCEKCGRAGQYRKQTLIERYGADIRLPDLPGGNRTMRAA